MADIIAPGHQANTAAFGITDLALRLANEVLTLNPRADALGEGKCLNMQQMAHDLLRQLPATPPRIDG